VEGGAMVLMVVMGERGWKGWIKEMIELMIMMNE